MSYSEYGTDRGISKLIKGLKITTDINWESRNLEVRINLQRRLLRVGSLPNYESVVEAKDPYEINPSESYRFALYGLKKNTKMKILKLVKF